MHMVNTYVILLAPSKLGQHCNFGWNGNQHTIGDGTSALNGVTTEMSNDHFLMFGKICTYFRAQTQMSRLT